MKRDALVKTNPYLRNTTRRAKLLAVTVNSSSAIEGAHVAVHAPRLITAKAKHRIK